jgi:Na+/melibiose symporter-like transporter
VTALFVGQFLDRLPFPLNYQIMFIALSIGGLISFTFSSRLRLRPIQKTDAMQGKNINEQVREYFTLILSEKPFVTFVLHRFVFLTGAALAAPIFPIYFVRVLNASDSWIAAINTASTAILIIGYFFWTNQSRKRGSMMVLLATTFGTSLYPILTGLTSVIWLIPLYAGISGIFQAGLNLVFFDELMQRVPVEYSATFIAAAQSIQYLSAIIAPLVGTWLAEIYGFNVVLILSGVVSLFGFALFAIESRHKPRMRTA